MNESTIHKDYQGKKNEAIFHYMELTIKAAQARIDDGTDIWCKMVNVSVIVYETAP